MARFEDDFNPRKLDEDALLDQLGGTKVADLPPTSSTMPVSKPAPFDGGLQTRTATDPAPVKSPAPSTGPYTGFQAKHDFSAFDTAREQNPEKSAKDAFAYLANQAPPPPFHDKAALGAWFNQYIKPGMDQLGHKVTSVDGDKFGFENWQGKFNVDYGQNAGAPAGSMLQRLQWGADSADPATAAMYAPGGSAPAYTPKSPAPPSQTGMQPTIDIARAMPQILAEIRALTNGQPSPMDQQALMELLQQGGVA